MFGKDKQAATKVDTLIGQQTEIRGDVLFTGGLHIDGRVKGNVIADSDTASLLTLSEQGEIEGEVRVPEVILNGRVLGDVHATGSIQLLAHACVEGNVYYSMVEMALGAEVNGQLVRRTEAETPVLALARDTQKSAEIGED